MIALIDYEVGNLFSIKASLGRIGAEAVLTRDPKIIAASDRIILPGVGAFGDASLKLQEFGLDKVLIDEAKAGKPLLGICLGMQLLFEDSSEYGIHPGLGLLKGHVSDLRFDLPDPESLVPHMGWNELVFKNPSNEAFWLGSRAAEYAGQRKGSGVYAYFVHSFYAKDCEEALVSWAEYDGVSVPALVSCQSEGMKVFGMQFHPEKSGADGLALLKKFTEI
ncbi:MAG: imidazole glycerol phosphate synthase subunit HisH [Firmicutes bacterium]|nr:imidazole glycerol phosphate synthase subunit HisH [Bacillota bacterium]